MSSTPIPVPTLSSTNWSTAGSGMITYPLPGDSNLWNQPSWSFSEINWSGFGVLLAVRYDGGSVAGGIAVIRCLSINITYELLPVVSTSSSLSLPLPPPGISRENATRLESEEKGFLGSNISRGVAIVLSIFICCCGLIVVGVVLKLVDKRRKRARAATLAARRDKRVKTARRAKRAKRRGEVEEGESIALEVIKTKADSTAVASSRHQRKQKHDKLKFSTYFSPNAEFSLDDISRQEGREGEVPEILITIFDFLSRKNAKNEEGILRIPGSTLLIQEMQTISRKGGASALESYLIEKGITIDAYDIASLMKSFFRVIPEIFMDGQTTAALATLCEFAINQELAQKQPDRELGAEGSGMPSEEVFQEIKYVISNELRPVQRKSLQSTLRFLKDVVDHSDVNKMNLSNVCRVMVPALRVLPAVLVCGIVRYVEIFEEPSDQKGSEDPGNGEKRGRRQKRKQQQVEKQESGSDERN